MANERNERQRGERLIKQEYSKLKKKLFKHLGDLSSKEDDNQDVYLMMVEMLRASRFKKSEVTNNGKKKALPQRTKQKEN